jgi:subtilase family serine protease
VRTVRVAPDGYVAVVVNRGHEFSGAFEVSFVSGGEPLGTQSHLGLAPGESAVVVQAGPPCRRGDLLEAIVDPGARIDEADEENDSLSIACPAP